MQREREEASQRAPRASVRLEVCRAARLVALAHAVERAIAAGEITDHSEAARQLGISQPHMAQIANLVHLAPDIQEALVTGRLNTSENELRGALRAVGWDEQREVRACPQRPLTSNTSAFTIWVKP